MKMKPLNIFYLSLTKLCKSEIKLSLSASKLRQRQDMYFIDYLKKTSQTQRDIYSGWWCVLSTHTSGKQELKSSWNKKWSQVRLFLKIPREWKILDLRCNSSLFWDCLNIYMLFWIHWLILVASQGLILDYLYINFKCKEFKLCLWMYGNVWWIFK